MNPDLKPRGKRARCCCAGCKNGAWTRRGGSNCETGCSLANDKSQDNRPLRILETGSYLTVCAFCRRQNIIEVLNHHHHHVKVLYTLRGSYMYTCAYFRLRTDKPVIVSLCNFDFCLHKCKHAHNSIRKERDGQSGSR